MRLDDIADPGLKAQIRAKLAEKQVKHYSDEYGLECARIDEGAGTGAGMEKPSDCATGDSHVPGDSGRKPPNRTEMAALDLLTMLAGGNHAGWVHGARSFLVLGGAHSYTPDWILTGNRVAVEVKAEYIRSRDGKILFDAARREYPDWTWVWLRFREKGLAGKRVEIDVWRATQ